jgi:RNA polymerase sigma-70 factor (ECF subfamily)
MDTTHLSDEALVEACRSARADERQALTSELFARHYERVARWCYRLTGDREAAADVAQEVFLKAHRHFDSFRGSSRFSTWLYAIVRNESLDRLRRQPPPAASDADEALADVPSLQPGPEEQAAAHSRGRRLHDFLADTLDDTERTVFTLHYGDEMPLAAITRLLGLDNTSGAKAYIVSAKRKLARAAERLRVKGVPL